MASNRMSVGVMVRMLPNRKADKSGVNPGARNLLCIVRVRVVAVRASLLRVELDFEHDKIAVSYTHLDVYKRQDMIRWSVR